MTPDIADHRTERKSIEDRAQARLDSLAKPPGSLGMLERVAVRLCAASGTIAPVTRPRTLVVFAADHGCVASSVSLWPSAVTVAIARTILSGGGAAGTMARELGVAVRLADVGMAADVPDHADLIRAPVRRATRDMMHEPALDPEEFDKALEVGASAAKEAIAQGSRLLIAGEVGIGNTTAAAAIVAHICGLKAVDVVGSGAGATPETLAAKAAVIEAALMRASQMPGRAGLAAVAGLEIAAMAGFYLEAARQGIPVVIDGAIAGAAALVAQALEADSTRVMIASHLSAERMHAAALRRLGLEPVLDWGMRLGEGTGALAFLPTLDLAAAIVRDMATLEEALA
ncbi:MAG: nicotinate-nucleotide--dimethylbenzimidazole phosphoribosyltransferase [Burkholderiales bacterium]|nr:MAG: nicotinate-nucleotide--dimethylbenzimidazole phosphoribosyltransferase [Burkholderiales bacterium]